MREVEAIRFKQAEEFYSRLNRNRSAIAPLKAQRVAQRGGYDSDDDKNYKIETYVSGLGLLLLLLLMFMHIDAVCVVCWYSRKFCYQFIFVSFIAFLLDERKELHKCVIRFECMILLPPRLQHYYITIKPLFYCRWRRQCWVPRIKSCSSYALTHRRRELMKL